MNWNVIDADCEKGSPGPAIKHLPKALSSGTKGVIVVGYAVAGRRKESKSRTLR